MDIVDACKSLIKEKLKELDEEQCGEPSDDEVECISTQNGVTPGSSYCELDKNVTKILNRQANLKRIIDQDNTIHLLKSSLNRITLEIEGLRTACTKLNEEALKSRQELVQTQAKELEKYQMLQIRSISEDYTRHQEILEQRKREIVALKKEIEREEKDRDAHLADVEKRLEKQLQERKQALSRGTLPFGMMPSASVSDQDEVQRLDLTSVDEYAPYGTAPHSRVSSNVKGKGATRGRGRGARRAKRG